MSNLKQTLMNTLYVAAVSAVVTVLINHYEQVAGQSISKLISDKLKGDDKS